MASFGAYRCARLIRRHNHVITLELDDFDFEFLICLHHTSYPRAKNNQCHCNWSPRKGTPFSPGCPHETAGHERYAHQRAIRTPDVAGGPAYAVSSGIKCSSCFIIFHDSFNSFQTPPCLARGSLLESRLVRAFLLVLRLPREILSVFRLARLAKRDSDRFALAKRDSSRYALAKRISNRFAHAKCDSSRFSLAKRDSSRPGLEGVCMRGRGARSQGMACPHLHKVAKRRRYC